MKGLVIAATLAAAVAGAAAVMPKYGVTVKADKKTDFAKFRTYAWTSGWSIFDPQADRMVVAAVDRELAALGLQKRDAEPCDVVVQYASLLRTDVDLRSKMSPVTKLRPEYPVGTLVVLLLEPHSRRELFRGRIDLPIETEPARFQAQFDSAIARVFAKYPTRRKSHHRP
jgi:uncharacterized protein DUF4136